MSVTFFVKVENPETVEVQCDLCDGSGFDWQDKGLDCYCCGGSGVMTRTLSPEINLANENAWAMLSALGVEFDYCGTLDVAAVKSALQRAILLANSEKAASSHTEESSYTPPGSHVALVPDGDGFRVERRGPAIHYNGRSVEYVQRTAARFVELLDFAAKRDVGVSWG